MSGRKNVLYTYEDPLLTAASMAASITGTPININFMDNVGIQLKWTGANPIGAITFQVSLDYDINTPTLGTWTTIQLTPGNNLTVSPAGTPDNAYVDLNQLSASWIRVVYTTAGGSVGALTANIAAKMI